MTLAAACKPVSHWAQIYSNLKPGPETLAADGLTSLGHDLYGTSHSGEYL
jgi:hypothetical protein